MAHYYACKFGLNRLRIDGDIRQKAAITAIMENVVIAMYRLRPIQICVSLRINPVKTWKQAGFEPVSASTTTTMWYQYASERHDVPCCKVRYKVSAYV